MLEAKVDLNFKIAKILVNHLGWKIEVNPFAASRYSLHIPLIHALSDPEEGEGEIEEEKDDDGDQRNHVPVTSNLRCLSKQTERQRGTKFELLAEYDDASRPYSAAFAEPASLRPVPFRPINEVPEFENQQQSPDGASTKSFRFDSAQGTRQHCASCLLMNSTMIIYF